MNALVASVIRTYTPVIVGQILGFLAVASFPIRPELTALLMAAVGGGLTLAYYTLVRVLEQQWPWFGVLLGLTKSPDTYTKGNAAPETAAVPANPALGAATPVIVPSFAPAETVTVEPLATPAVSFAPTQAKINALTDPVVPLDIAPAPAAATPPAA